MINNRKGATALLILSSLASISIIFIKTNLIVLYGIRFYKGLLAAFLFFQLFSLINLLRLWFVSILQRRKKSEVIQPSANEEPEYAPLSVRTLKSDEVKALLKNMLLSDWVSCKSIGAACYNQISEIQKQRITLHNLLDANDAAAISDTEDVLLAVENLINRNVRKVINYMTISDSRKPEDVNRVKSELSECYETNLKILEQTSEFILAIADFLNHQGENQSDLDVLSVYKKALLDVTGQIEEGGIKLV